MPQGLDDNQSMNWAVIDWLKPDCYGTTKNQISMKIGSMTLYFSFKTIVGFSQLNGEVTLSPNVWGQHTGQHLGKIRAIKEISVECETREEFELLLDDALLRLFQSLGRKLPYVLHIEPRNRVEI